LSWDEIEEIVPDNGVKEVQAEVPEQILKDPHLTDRSQEGDGHDLGQKGRSS
jgi:hypothetical protein